MTLCASSSSVRSGVSRRSGFFGPLVRAVDAGEVRDLARARFGVQALGITLLAFLERGVAEHLEEVEAGVGVHFTGQLPVFGQRADRRHQHDLAGVGQQRRHMRQPAQVLRAVGHGKAQVGIQAVPQVVTVENISGKTLFEQLLLDQHGHRRLAGAGQAGEPHRPARGRRSSAVTRDLCRTVFGLAVCAEMSRNTMPAATVPLVFGSMRMNEPVLALRVYSSSSSGTWVRSEIRPSSLSFNAVARLVAMQGVDIEPIVQRGDLRAGGSGGVLDDVVAAGLQRRGVGHPAHGRIEFLRDPGLVVGAGDQVAARDVDVVGKAHRDSHRRKRFFHRPIRAFDRGDPGGLADRQHHHFVAGTHHPAGHGAGVAAVVLMLVGLRPDDVLHREPHVDQVAVAGDVDLFEVREQRRSLVPRASGPIWSPRCRRAARTSGWWRRPARPSARRRHGIRRGSPRISLCPNRSGPSC